MDLNLLPQDLRPKEEKEKNKSKNQSHDFEVELFNPSKISTSKQNKTNSNKTSWWQNLLGQPQKYNKPVTLTEPLENNLDNKADSGDWLKSNNTMNNLAKNHSPSIKKSGFWPSLLGRPISLIASNEINTSEIGTTNKSNKLEYQSFQPTKDIYNKVAEKKPVSAPKSDGWGAVLKGLFVFGNSKKVKDLHFANENSITSAVRENQTVAQTPLINGSEKIKTPVKNNKIIKKSAYHLAPKRESTNVVNVNFIPGDLVPSNNLLLSEIRFLIISVLIPILVVSTCYGTLLILQNQANKQMKTKQAELGNLEKSIGDFLIKEKQHNVFSNRLLAIKKILGNKKVWSNFFDYLEKYTLDGVYFTNLSADTSGILVLPGIADSYSVLAKQLAVFAAADDFLKDFKISNSQLYSENKAGVVGVSFQLRLNLKDDLLKATK